MTARVEPSLGGIERCAEAIAPWVRTTPTVLSYTFSESAGCEVYLKLENLQRTGSFKLRGALAKLLSLSAEERARGLVAASAGNHAQGVALAAKLLGAPATIVMPVTTALIKVHRTEGYGAEVRLQGESWNESQALAEELSRERGLLVIHPFDDPTVIEGQGTVGLEILEEVEGVDTLVVPVGGGGLVAGIATAVKALRPEVRIVGVQAEGAAAMVASVRQGTPVIVEHPWTIAEGIRVGSVGELTFPLVHRLVDELVTVTEEEITDAVVATLEKSKVVAEAAAVVGLAALAAGKVATSGRVCAVVSGGNIDSNQLARLIESGLASAGRTALLQLRMADVPGELQGVIECIVGRKANILDVQHYRAGWKVPVGFVDVEVLVETRYPGDAALLAEDLRGRGYEVAP